MHFQHLRGFEGKAKELGFESLDNIFKYWNISSLLNISVTSCSLQPQTYFLCLKCVSLYLRISVLYHKCRTGTTRQKLWSMPLPWETRSEAVWPAQQASEGLGTALHGGLPEGQLVSLRKLDGYGANSGWGLGFCFSVLQPQVCSPVFLFLLQPNPIAEGSAQSPLQTDGVQSSAGVVWDGPPASPFAWSFLITHQPEPDWPRKNSSSPRAKLCPLTYEN